MAGIGISTMNEIMHNEDVVSYCNKNRDFSFCYVRVFLGYGSVVRSLEGIRSLIFFTSDTVNTLGLNWCFLSIITII